MVKTSDFAISGRSMNGRWQKMMLGDRILWGLKLEPGAVWRVFAGVRFADIDWLHAWGAEHSVAIERATPSPETWDLEFVAN